MRPLRPNNIQSPRSCIIDPNEPYTMPPGRNIDWEGELAIIIGKPAFNLTEAQAHDYVFGYSIMNDVSARDVQMDERKEGNICIGKNFPTACPFGPWIVTKDEIIAQI